MFFRDSSGNRLLSEDDDSWGEPWGPEGGKTQNQQNASDWSAGNDDDLEAWLNEDSPYKGMLGKEKQVSSSKKLGKDNKKTLASKSKPTSKGSDWNDADWDEGFTSLGKQSEPLVGNLVDLGTEDGNGSSKKTDSGWDNEVWADEEDEWQTLDLESSSKGKKSS